jgi:putative protease
MTMGFFKKIGKALFGNSKPKKIVKTPKKAPKKKIAKPAKKKTKKPLSKKAAKKKSVKPSAKGSKKKVPAKRRMAVIKSAMAALPAATVTHYFPHVNAAVLKIKTGEIRIGDELHFKGHTTDFNQKVISMQIDHKPVLIAKKGDDFGVEVKSRVRAGDLVFKK